MYLSFLWCSERREPAAARKVFQQILERQRKLYSDAWGIPATASIYQQDSVFIGQVYSDPGVLGWQPWIERDCGGLVWSGVCENFLGTEFDTEQTRDVLTTLARSPEDVCNWDGKYYVISWDRQHDRICLTTGATECPTLWSSQGPYGWAAGSRGAPLLEMVGHDKQLSVPACNVSMAYGYNYSNAALLEHVQRVPQRTQITVQPGKAPGLSRYASLEEYFGTVEECPDRDEVLAVCADRLITRIGRQLKYSLNPEILITGGRDSRAIAAAAKQVGFPGPVSTGGPADSSDIVIGAAVADRLQLSHLHTPDRVSMAQFGRATDRLTLWSTMSEGTEVLRHARAYNRFVEGDQHPVVGKQLFHGLGGEISRGYYYKNADNLKLFAGSDFSIGRKRLLAAADPGVPLSPAAMDLLEERWDEFSQDAASSRIAVTDWLDLFFWQNSCLRWGEDMLSVKNAMYWAWSPFLDRVLINYYRRLDPEDKRSDRFIQDLVLKIRNELTGLDYDQPTARKKKSKSLPGRFFRKARRILKGRTVPPCSEMTAFWEAALLNVPDPVWKNFLKEDSLRQLIVRSPDSEILWNAATIEFVANAFRQTE